jgi:intracellular sulfur oxidation DsrE/DsrF family protein
MKSWEDTGTNRLCELLDGELAEDQKREVLDAVRRDAALRRRLHEYRRVRELVRAAFATNEAPRRARRLTWYRSLAAGVLLALGFAVGWAAHVGHGEMTGNTMAIAEPSTFQVLAQRIDTHPDGLHALLHVDSRNPVMMETALDEAESLLRSYRREHKDLKLEILANAGGLDLFRTGVSRFRRRIARMQRQYPNVTFLACGRTIQRLEMEKKITPHLLPGVRVVPSALDQILRRLNEGWVYVKA